MITFLLSKSPEQVLAGVAIDFAGEFAEGETVASFTVDDESTGVVTASAANGSRVVMTLAGGTAGQEIDITVSATGDAGSVYPDAVIRLSVSSSAAYCTISADLRDLGMQPVAGVPLTVQTRAPQVLGGVLVDGSTSRAVTDENGQAQVTVAQGLEVVVSFPPLQSRLVIDTTDKALVDLAEYV
jgi:hypothetical protein